METGEWNAKSALNELITNLRKKYEKVTDPFKGKPTLSGGRYRKSSRSTTKPTNKSTKRRLSLKKRRRSTKKKSRKVSKRRSRVVKKRSSVKQRSSSKRRH